MSDVTLNPLSNRFPKPVVITRTYQCVADAIADNPELSLEKALYDKFSEPTWRNMLLATAPGPVSVEGEPEVEAILARMRKDMIGV